MTRIANDEGPQLSVVVPLFDEMETLAEMYRRLVGTLDDVGLSFELVLVDDGSKDATAAQLDRLAARDARVRVVRLSRNFGHQAAVSAGLDYARGEAVAVMDGDLQDPPELLPTFIERWREGYDVVYAVRRQRKEGVLKRAGYFLFYRLFRAVAEVDVPLDSGDFCLMDRKVVDALIRLPERQRFVRGLRSFVGFRQVGIEYERNARAAGVSKYSFRKLAGLAVDGIVNLSSLPLKLVAGAGLVVTCAGLILALLFLGQAVFGYAGPTGWAVVLAAIFAVGGGQMLALGVVGEYVRRIFVEVKGRPTYIVSETSSASAATPQVRRARAG